MQIEGEDKESVLASLGDPESLMILGAVSDSAKSVGELMEVLKLTQSTIYRKISSLRACGLLTVESFEITPDGKRRALYACTFKELTIRRAGNGLQLDLVETERIKERRWLKLFAPAMVTPPEGAASDSDGT